ncbi:MAG: response regulator transcription factor [Gammaproteobacteria bacterium]
MRILVADDHPLFRDALARLVARIEPTATVHEADSHAAVRARLAEDSDYDLMLLDLRMPGGDAGDTVKRLHQEFPRVPIIVVSASDHAWDIRQAIQSGALGFISKSVSEASLRDSLTRVLAGELPGDGNALTFTDVDTTLQPEHRPELTTRQRQVLQLMCDGESNKQIARKLELTVGTVKLHVCAILQALNVANRTQAVLKAHELGYAGSTRGK